MRMHFKAGLNPAVVRQCMSAFRLHEASKTVSVWDKFIREFAIIHAEYKPHLSMKDRYQWWAGRREIEAKNARSRMWLALKQRDVKAARREAMAAMTGQPLSPDSWKSLYFALRGR
jgi:hypothetical protein